MVDSFASEEWASQLSEADLVVRNESVAIYEQMTGKNISDIYHAEQAIYLVYQATGYEVILHPESMEKVDFPFAQMPVYKRADVSKKYIGDELSYPQAMVFVQYLVEKYSLDTIIEAQMDAKAYRKLFPDAAAFQKEYDTFVAQIEFE